MDIGILTGFAPDKKSLQKVDILLLSLQRILDLSLGIFYLIFVLRGNSSSLANSQVLNLTLSRKWLLISWVVSLIFPQPHHTYTHTHFQMKPHVQSQVFWVCVNSDIVSVRMVRWEKVSGKFAGNKKLKAFLLEKRNRYNIDLLATKKVVLERLICWLLCVHDGPRWTLTNWPDCTCSFIYTEISVQYEFR